MDHARERSILNAQECYYMDSIIPISDLENKPNWATCRCSATNKLLKRSELESTVWINLSIMPVKSSQVRTIV